MVYNNILKPIKIYKALIFDVISEPQDTLVPRGDDPETRNFGDPETPQPWKPIYRNRESGRAEFPVFMFYSVLSNDKFTLLPYVTLLFFSCQMLRIRRRMLQEQEVRREFLQELYHLSWFHCRYPCHYRPLHSFRLGH